MPDELTPVTNIEKFLAKTAGEAVDLPEPVTRIEKYLNKISSEQSIISATDNWLDEHIDPDTGYALDTTLTLTNAAAPAKTVGDALTLQSEKIDELKSAINQNQTEVTNPVMYEGYYNFTKADMESGSFTSAGYVDDNTRCRLAYHNIKVNVGDIIVGNRIAGDILFGVIDSPTGVTTLYTSGWRTSDFALECPYDGYLVLLGKTSLANFDGDFQIYPVKQDFDALPEDYYETEIATTISSIMAKQTEPCLCFPLVTDIHYGSATTPQAFLFHKTYRNIKRIAFKIRFDAVVCLGDITEGNFSSKSMVMDHYANRINNMFRQLNVPYLLTIGNHDDNRYGSSSAKLTASDMCITYTSKVYDRVVYNEGTNGRDYYIDFDNLKIRMISLDSTENYTYAFDDATVTWFTNTALDTPDGYTAIIMTHCSPIAAQNYDQGEPTNGASIAQAIEDYIESGKDAFQLYGHSHCDDAFISPYLSICTCCEKFTNENGDPSKWPEGATMPQRTEGTATEDLWDFVIVRPHSKKVNLIRFGAGDDREFTYGT